ncbi:AraC family transcriptional regulator [Anaerobacillus alkalidiazotrophicus]|uniref:AraC family transcriptional regulator n=1 Tax=Anaerobacillus alkalidiazotrophicus TaxID=472963 RepID=A0A1S2MBW9_9BACI|nr:AraC family transcriptional regulator [Anaerobacillus alkalidiazotrophicus]OIJ22282.1 AraC family transcriptional regulator [Anaerobacillus alkalidiazotrophicus]
MTVQIGFCSYSHHTKGYSSQEDKLGLSGYLFRLQTEGVCDIVLNKKKLTFSKGGLLLAKPGDLYEIHIEGNQNSGDYNLFCEGSWIDEWWNRSVKPTSSQINLDEKVLTLWRHLTIEERRPMSEKNKELSSYLLKALCLSLERAINETTSTGSRPYPVTRMMRYIEEHATTVFKVEDVAQYAGLSVSRAVHLFKSSTGKTIVEYAQEIRLSTAVNQMKYTSMTLEHIADNCGFGTYAYFHRVFKKKYGVSPGEYRKQE